MKETNACMLLQKSEHKQKVEREKRELRYKHGRRLV